MLFLHRRTRSQPPPYQETRPYIGLKARLSQIWINQYTIVLIVIIIKLALFQLTLNGSLKSTEKYTMSSCQSAESIASQASSMPHYLSTAANKVVEKSMDASVSALIKTIKLVITGVEELIIFALELWIGTFACLATAAVDGTAGAALNATQEVVTFVNDTLDDITDGLETGLDGLSSVINTLGGVANDVKNLFTGDDDNNGKDDLDKVNLQIDALKGLHIPTEINTKLKELQEDLPTYDDLKNKTENLIREPFDLLKNQLNKSLESELQFDAKHIKVPSKHTVEFCKSKPGIPEFFNDVRDSVSLVTRILIIILVIVAVLVCVPLAWREFRNWRWVKQCAAEQAALARNKTLDKMQAIHDASNHMVVKVQNFASNRFKTDEHKTLARWWIDYVLYTPAATLLLIALSGIVMVILQYIILYQVKNAIPAWQDSVEHVTASFTNSIKSEATHWTNSTNDAIIKQQDKINDDMLGWVSIATESVNSTLSTFQKQMNKALKDTFDGTPLYKPISTVVYCVIGTKIDKAEKGLTWVHDNAKVSFPTVDDDFITGGENGTESFDPEKIGQDIADLMGTALTSLIGLYEKTLNLELYISCVLLACWLIVALFGIVYCLVQYRKQQNSIIRSSPPPPPPPPPVIVPEKQQQEPNNTSVQNGKHEIPSFEGNSWQYSEARFQPSFLMSEPPNSPMEGRNIHSIAPGNHDSVFVHMGEKPGNTVTMNESPVRKSVRGGMEVY